MASASEAVKRLRIEASESGVDQTRARLVQLAAAQGNVAVATATASQASANFEQRLVALQAKYDAVIRQQAAFAQAQAQVTAAANDNNRAIAASGLEWAEWGNHLRQAGEAALVLSPRFRALVFSLREPVFAAAANGIEATAGAIVKATNVVGRGMVEVGVLATRSSAALAPFGAAVAMTGASLAAFNPTLASVAGTILSRVLPALRMLSGALLIYDAIKLVGEAWDLGGKKLDEYRAIAERAAKVDLSTTYFQKLQKGAEDSKVSVDELTRMLQNLQKASADALGGSALEQRLQKHLEAGNFRGNAGVDLLRQANTLEQRYDAIVTLINRAMQAGQRLAAIDLANTAFGPEVAENLRRDAEYLDKMKAAADRVKESQIVSPEEIGRAVELQRRYDDAVKILEQRWHPIQDLLTSLGIRMREAWVDIVEAIAKAVDNVAKLIAKIGEIPQSFWDFVKGGVNLAAKGVAAVAPYSPVLGPAVGAAAGAVANATAPTVSVDAYGDAVNRLRAGLQNQAEMQRKVNEANTIAQKVYGDTSNTLDKQRAATTAQADAYVRARESVQKHTAQLEAEGKALGLGAGALAQYKAEAQLTTAAIQAQREMTPALRAEIEALAKAAGQAAENNAKLRVRSQIEFDRKTIGLSDDDVRIAQQLAKIYGDDIPAALASAEAAQMRLNAAGKEFADGIRDVGKSIFNAFLSGKNVMDAMVASLDRLADKLANSAFDNILSGNPLQMGIGALQAGASALISAFTGDQKAKKELEEAKTAWEAMADQLLAFNRAAAGFDLGPLTQELESLRQAHDTLAMAALKAKDYAGLNQVHETLNKGIQRIFGEWMNGAPVLGELSQKIADLTNEARGLAEAIPDAAAAIDEGLIRRINELVRATENSLRSEINSARGFDWLNDINAAVAKFNDLAGKVDPTLLNEWFSVTLQKIVDGAELTGEAFNRLVSGIPQIAGYIHEFAGAVEGAAEVVKRSAAEIASARQSYQDQLFILLQDQSTLSGQLAVYDLQAQRAREAEIAKGGEALADLEALQAQQRYNIAQDFGNKQVDLAKQQAEQQSRALEQAQREFDGFVRSITDFVSHYLSSPDSGLSPQQQLANAQAAFNSQLALAQSGDRDALNSITSYFQDLDRANTAYNASSAAGAAIRSSSLAALQALPTQISPEQFIVDAIESAGAANVSGLGTINTSINNALISAVASNNATAFATALVPHFNALLDPTTGLLKQAQLESKLNLPDGSLDKIFKELDGNGNGILEKSELQAKLLSGTNAGPLTQTKTNTDTLPAQATKIAGMETSLLAMAQVSGATQNSATLLSSILLELSNGDQKSAAVATRLMIREQNARWGLAMTGNQLISIPQYARGTNYHPGGPAIVGENGPELIPNLPAGARVIPNHIAFGNDNGGGEIRELRAALGQVISELREIKREARGAKLAAARGHKDTIEALQGGNEISAQALRQRSRDVQLRRMRGK